MQTRTKWILFLGALIIVAGAVILGNSFSQKGALVFRAAPTVTFLKPLTCKEEYIQLQSSASARSCNGNLNFQFVRTGMVNGKVTASVKVNGQAADLPQGEVKTVNLGASGNLSLLAEDAGSQPIIRLSSKALSAKSVSSPNIAVPDASLKFISGYGSAQLKMVFGESGYQSLKNGLQFNEANLGFWIIKGKVANARDKIAAAYNPNSWVAAGLIKDAFNQAQQMPDMANLGGFGRGGSGGGGGGGLGGELWGDNNRVGGNQEDSCGRGGRGGASSGATKFTGTDRQGMVSSGKSGGSEDRSGLVGGAGGFARQESRPSGWRAPNSIDQTSAHGVKIETGRGGYVYGNGDYSTSTMVPNPNQDPDNAWDNSMNLGGNLHDDMDAAIDGDKDATERLKALARDMGAAGSGKMDENIKAAESQLENKAFVEAAKVNPAEAKKTIEETKGVNNAVQENARGGNQPTKTASGGTPPETKTNCGDLDCGTSGEARSIQQVLSGRSSPSSRTSTGAGGSRPSEGANAGAAQGIQAYGRYGRGVLDRGGQVSNPGEMGAGAGSYGAGFGDFCGRNPYPSGTFIDAAGAQSVGCAIMGPVSNPGEQGGGMLGIGGACGASSRGQGGGILPVYGGSQRGGKSILNIGGRGGPKPTDLTGATGIQSQQSSGEAGAGQGGSGPAGGGRP